MEGIFLVSEGGHLCLLYIAGAARCVGGFLGTVNYFTVFMLTMFSCFERRPCGLSSLSLRGIRTLTRNRRCARVSYVNMNSLSYPIGRDNIGCVFGKCWVFG